MAGTPEGGKLAAETTRQRYGQQFMEERGRKGGKIGHGGGFATMDKDKLIKVSRKGGRAPKAPKVSKHDKRRRRAGEAVSNNP